MPISNVVPNPHFGNLSLPTPLPSYLMSIGAASRYCNTSPASLRRAIRRGDLPAIRMNGGNGSNSWYKFSYLDLDKLCNINQKGLTEEGLTQEERKPAIYCRVSSQGQKQKGYLDTQIKVCKEYCLKMYKCDNPHLYVDVASAWGYRPEFYKCLTKIQEGMGMVSVLISSYKDRQARSPAILRYIEYLARKTSTQLIYINKEESASDSDSTQENMMELVSYIGHLSAKSAGRRSSASRKIDLSTDIIRVAYLKRAEGLSTRTVAKHLSDHGYVNKKGNVINSSTLDSQLKKNWEALTALYGDKVKTHNSFDKFFDEHCKIVSSDKAIVNRATLMIQYERFIEECELLPVSYTSISRGMLKRGIKHKTSSWRTITYLGLSLVGVGGKKE